MGKIKINQVGFSAYSVAENAGLGDLLFYFQAVGVLENICYSNLRRLKLSFVHAVFYKQQFPVVQLQLLVKGKYSVNLLCFLL